MNLHLSTEEVSAWLSGKGTRECEEHLRRCAECKAELERIQEPIALFRKAVLEWSAGEGHRPVAIPARSSPGSWWLRIAATAAVLVALIAIGVGGQNRRAAGIAQEDEILLGQVQAAVSRPVPASMQPVYNLMVEGTP